MRLRGCLQPLGQKELHASPGVESQKSPNHAVLSCQTLAAAMLEVATAAMLEVVTAVEAFRMQVM